MTKIEKIEKLIKEGELLKVRAGDKVANLQTQYKKKADELSKLGITDIKSAEEELAKKQELLEEKISKALELIPEDIINKYKNYDFAGAKTETELNLEMPF